jgi:Mrp family chromosome partitioning ATPase
LTVLTPEGGALALEGDEASAVSAPGALDHRTWKLIAANAAELATLGARLMNEAALGEARTVLVTSSHPSEGRTLTAVGLAQTLASHIRSRVALLDANFVRSRARPEPAGSPRLHELYGLAAAPGLADVLASGYPCRSAVQETRQENLSVMTAGRPLSGSVGRREVEALRQVLAELGSTHDYVIVDGSDCSRSSDVSLVARVFDAVVLVIECEKTSWEVVRQAADGVRKSGGRLLGAVLNKRRYYIPGRLYGKV